MASSNPTTGPPSSSSTYLPQPPLPTPPFILIDGLANFRDIGGQRIQDQPGKAVRRNVMFRSSEPSRLTDQGVASLQSLGISHVYDLRSLREIDHSVKNEGGRIRDWQGAQRLHLPIFLEEDYNPDAIAERFRNFATEGSEGFVRAYSRILHLGADESHPYRPFTTILHHLVGVVPSPPTPLLVHCTAGKDRTGLICAVVLSLVGVADSDVADEYSLTDVGLASRREELIGNLLQTPGSKVDRTEAERMIGARKEHMLAALTALRQTYGSVETYVRDSCGLSAEEVEQIRRNMVVDVKEE